MSIIEELEAEGDMSFQVSNQFDLPLNQKEEIRRSNPNEFEILAEELKMEEVIQVIDLEEPKLITEGRYVDVMREDGLWYIAKIDKITSEGKT